MAGGQERETVKIRGPLSRIAKDEAGRSASSNNKCWACAQSVGALLFWQIRKAKIRVQFVALAIRDYFSSCHLVVYFEISKRTPRRRRRVLASAVISLVTCTVRFANFSTACSDIAAHSQRKVLK